VGQEGGDIGDRAPVDSARGEAIVTARQVAIIAAIVATLMYLPLVLVLALVLRAAGIAFATFATFGGSFGLFFGLGVWWLVAFAGAFLYASFLFQWSDKVSGWPKKR